MCAYDAHPFKSPNLNLANTGAISPNFLVNLNFPLAILLCYFNVIIARLLQIGFHPQPQASGLTVA